MYLSLALILITTVSQSCSHRLETRGQHLSRLQNTLTQKLSDNELTDMTQDYSDNFTNEPMISKVYRLFLNRNTLNHGQHNDLDYFFRKSRGRVQRMPYAFGKRSTSEDSTIDMFQSSIDDDQSEDDDTKRKYDTRTSLKSKLAKLFQFSDDTPCSVIGDKRSRLIQMLMPFGKRHKKELY